MLMKNAVSGVIVYQLFVFISLLSCQSIIKGPTDKFIPGTYVRSSEHEFGKEKDTLIITLQIANRYKIERRWKYERMLDGKPIEPEYKQTTTSAVYDEKEHVLNETKTGLEYSFEQKRGLLFAGETEYHKIQ
jgi:hypothetical protein